MKTWILLTAAMMLLMGCSKDGSKAQLMDGGVIDSTMPDPAPTDANFPELGPK